ncbi:MAG: hypothetical protein HYZ43_05415 [Flavobacteriia bacterium]|nr:hypothetical protein [Flavobacteriia bacterium]
MQALIEEMGALIVKIKSGVATQGELEAFAAAAGELNERAIILRYKSYEAKVFGTPSAPAVEKAVVEVVEETPKSVQKTKSIHKTELAPKKKWKPRSCMKKYRKLSWPTTNR